MLSEILSQSPNDAFARYGLAMEYSKSGNAERAMEEFGKLLAAHPDYTAGYFMARTDAGGRQPPGRSAEDAGGRDFVGRADGKFPRTIGDDGAAG